MKRLIIFGLFLLAAVLFVWWLVVSLTPVPVLPAKAPAASEPKIAGQAAPVSLPRVVTLYQRGDGESDLAVYVSNELRRIYGNKAEFKLIDVNEEPEAAGFYGVSETPSVIILSARGNVLFRHEGYAAKEVVLEKLDQL